MVERTLRPPDTPLTEDDLKEIIRQQVQNAVGGLIGSHSQIAIERTEAMDRYYGKRYGDEIAGRSQYVSHDVQDVIEWMMPALVEIFTASGQLFRFEPVGEEDEEMAKQATEYINYILFKENDGFRIVYDWIKDALLQKVGVVKAEWEEEEKTTRHTYTDLDEASLAILLAEPDVEPIEFGTDPETGLSDITILRHVREGKPVVYSIPPENFIIESRSEDIEDARYLGDDDEITVSELIEMGYDPELVRGLPTGEARDWSFERVSRFDDEFTETLEDGLDLDPSQREVWVTNSYFKVDMDGDGIAEMRKVVTAGPEYTILENVEVDDHPYCSICPIPMPHRFFGLSVADQVIDLQRINTTIWRQYLDNLYTQNNARTAISRKVNIDDILTPRVGGPIRVATDNGDVAGHLVPMQTAPLGQAVLPALEYVQRIREQRTGQSPYPHDMSTRNLNQTATGITAILGESQKRLQLIARVCAETGIRDLGRKLLKMVVQHQDRPKTIRLRNQWVEVDPRSWNAEMDVTIVSGLGYGSKDQQMAVLTAFQQYAQGVLALQGGPNGPVIDWEQIYNYGVKFLEAGGFKATDPFLSDPTTPEAQQMLQQQAQQEPPPDPRVIEAQAKAQQMMQEQAQKDMLAQRDAARKDWEAERENERKVLEIELAHQREAAKAGIELDLKEGQITGEQYIKLHKAETDDQIARRKADTDEEIARRKSDTDNDLASKKGSEKGVAINLGTGKASKDIGDSLTAGITEGFKGTADAMKEMAEGMKDTAAGLKEASDAFEKVAEEEAKPKRVVVHRDKDGKMTGATLQ